MNDEKIELKQQELNVNHQVGFVLSLIGMAIQLILPPWFFLLHYDRLMIDEVTVANCPTCFYIIRYFLPIYTDVAIIAGIFYFIAAVGFYKKENWAIYWAVWANILALFTSFWPMVPEMDTGNTILYLWIFLPETAMWFLITRFAGGISWGRIITGLFTGMAMVTTFMNGTASVNTYMKTMRNPDTVTFVKASNGSVYRIGESFFVLTQRLNWLAAIGMMIVTFYVLFKPDFKVRMLGIVSAAISILLGTPLGIKISFIKNEISMMLYAPALSFIYIIVFIFNPLWEKFVQPVDS